MANYTLVLHVPGLHRGFWKLFQKYHGSNLYILGDEILNEFPIFKREIRALDPIDACWVAGRLNFFKSVRLATKLILMELAQDKDTSIVLANDNVSDQLFERYFSSRLVILENIFLRYDEKYVAQTYGEANYDTKITSGQFYRDILVKLSIEADRSADWWRQTAAALLVGDPPEVELVAQNLRMPTDNEVWLVGDPRMYIDHGSQPYLKTVAHAEEAVIAEAAKRGIKTDGAEMVVLTYPCPGCQNLIALAGIKKLYFKTGYAELPDHEVLGAYGVEVIKVE